MSKIDGAAQDPFRQLFQPDEMHETERALAAERRRADAAMAWKFANLTMPEDIRSRARSWGMEAFCETLWNNAFQAGYREALRPAPAEQEDSA